MTNETSGRSLKSLGNAVSGWLVAPGRFVKLTQGLCLRAYFPLPQPV